MEKEQMGAPATYARMPKNLTGSKRWQQNRESPSELRHAAKIADCQQ
jgi:hypothetical protein